MNPAFCPRRLPLKLTFLGRRFHPCQHFQFSFNLPLRCLDLKTLFFSLRHGVRFTPQLVGDFVRFSDGPGKGLFQRKHRVELFNSPRTLPVGEDQLPSMIPMISRLDEGLFGR